jgi:acid-sensing ion channel, other
VIIFVVSITFCVITTLDVYSKRQIRPVMISFAKGLSSSAEIPFPAVTICPESKVSKHELDLASVFSRDIINLTDDEIRKIRNLAQVCDFGDKKNFSWVFNDSSSQADIIPFLENVGNPMNQMINRCHFGSREMSDCEKLFSRVVTDEGACFSFNMLDHSDLFVNEIDEFLKLPFHGKSSDWFLEKEYKSDKLSVFPRRVFGSGLQSGLLFELKMKRSNLNPCKRGIKGFRLALHSPVEIPRMSKLFYSIPFEKQTTISVEPVMMYSSKDIKDYDPVSRQCYFQGERILKFFKTYTKANCELECLAKLTLTLCGCVLFSMPRDNSTEICNLSKIKCAQDAEVSYVTQNLEYKLLHKHLQKDLKHGLIKKDDEGFKKLKEIESCNCLPSCTSLRYNAEISQTDFVIDDEEE